MRRVRPRSEYSLKSNSALSPARAPFFAEFAFGGVGSTSGSNGFVKSPRARSSLWLTNCARVGLAYTTNVRPRGVTGGAGAVVVGTVPVVATASAESPPLQPANTDATVTRA